MATRASAKSTPIIRWSKEDFIKRTFLGHRLPRPAVYEQVEKAPGSFELTPNGFVEVRNKPRSSQGG